MKRLTTEQKAKLLYKAKHEPRRNQKRFLRDLGGEGTAEELDAMLVTANKDKEAIAEANRMSRQREITAKTVDAGVESGVAEVLAALRLRMEDKGWTQTDLAGACGWSQPVVGAYLTGRKLPGLSNLVAMASALDCEIQLVRVS